MILTGALLGFEKMPSVPNKASNPDEFAQNQAYNFDWSTIRF